MNPSQYQGVNSGNTERSAAPVALVPVLKQIAVTFGRLSTGKYLQFVIVYTTTKETIFSKQHTVGKKPKI